MDFTKPWLRGQRVIPRKDKDTPPRMEPVIKIVPLTDEDGKVLKPRVIHDVPMRRSPWVVVK